MKLTFRPKSSPIISIEQRLEIVSSPVYPIAVPDHFICSKPDDYYMRAYSIIHGYIDDPIEGKHFYDYAKDQHVLDEALLSKAILEPPYDIILLYDILDHCPEDPIVILRNLGKLLSPTGKIYIRCHPWCSGHCSHLYRTINKAYIHLLFTPQEIATVFKTKSAFIRKVSDNPMELYYDWFNKANLRVFKSEMVSKLVEPIFHQFKMKKIIFTDKLINLMSIQFVDFCVGKNDRE